MAVDVIMPQMGESVVEGTVSKWLKKEGEEVKEDEPLLEITTDKIDVELPSPAAGVLGSILVKEGETVKVGATLAQIAAPGERVAAPAEPPSAAPPEEAPAEEAPRIPPGKRSSPLVRRLARENGINIQEVPGTGIGGRVTKKDLLSFMETRKAAPPPPTVSPPPSPPLAPEAAPPSLKPGEELLPLSIMRRSIAEHMARSATIAPHVTAVVEVDMTEVVRYRQKVMESFAKEEGFHLTYMPFIIKATIEGLREHPLVNSTFTPQGLILKHYINIGVAVALDDGLIVPVVKRADEKSLRGLARELHDLATRARAKNLSVEEVQGGTFTITNPGAFGTILGTPIISQPQVAILGVESVVKRPVVIDDAIAIRSMMNLCLSFDHRAIDGAIAAKFLGKLKETLEHFNFSAL